MLQLVILVFAILILSFAINSLLLNSVGPLYRIFVAPGVILHELSHAFMCLLTGAQVTSINMFKKDGGEVLHGKPKIPVIGQILISLAPFAAGAVAIYFLAKAIGINSGNVTNLTASVHDFPIWIRTTLVGISFSKITSWVALYLVLSIAVTMTPSAQDIKNILLSLVVLFAIAYLIYRYTHFRPDLNFLARPEFIMILGSVLILLIFGLILSIIIFAVKNMITA